MLSQLSALERNLHPFLPSGPIFSFLYAFLCAYASTGPGKTLHKKDGISEKVLEALVLKPQDAPEANLEVVKMIVI